MEGADSVQIFGTAAAALVVDRMGRIKSLEVSFIIQGLSLFLLAALIRESELTTGARSRGIGIAAAAFVFVFLWFFTMFNIGKNIVVAFRLVLTPTTVPCWIYSTEIWPQEIRAKGYSFTIFGWAIGCGKLSAFHELCRKAESNQCLQALPLSLYLSYSRVLAGPHLYSLAA